MELPTARSKASLLMSLAATNPGEVFDRVRTKVEDLLDRLNATPFSGQTISWEQVAKSLLEERADGIDPGAAIENILREPELNSLERDLRGRIGELAGAGPFQLSHNADFSLARLCYLACRVLRPAVVVETGVCYGVTSSFILTALCVNGTGDLHSVDLPPLARDARSFVGALIPEPVRDRWHLHRGAVRRILPRLLDSLGKIDMFVHDSLHTHATMSFELELASRYLRPNSLVVADDVGGNMAFPTWLNAVNHGFAAVVREQDKGSIFGVGLVR